MDKITIKLGFLLIAFLFFNVTMYSQTSSSDEILGTWWFPAKKANIEVYKEGDIYYGKIVSGTRQIEEDVNNPDKTKRNLPLVGKVILKNIKYSKKRKWNKGMIYDPDNGKTFTCVINMKNINTLEVTGYRGITFFGKTFKWTRVAKNNNEK